MCLFHWASPQTVPLQLCAGLQWPLDHRFTVNGETHTSVIKAVGGLVLEQLLPILLLLKPASLYDSILSAQLIIVQRPVLPRAVLSLSNDGFQRSKACVLPAPGAVGATHFFRPVSLSHEAKIKFISYYGLNALSYSLHLSIPSYQKVNKRTFK